MPSKKLAVVIILIGVMSTLTLTFYAGVSARLVGACPVTPPEVCVTLHDPVYGVPTFRTYANSCVACAEGAWLWIKATA